jgi:hypothetical protein
VGLAAISDLFAHVNGTGANMAFSVQDADFVHKGVGGSDLTYVFALASYASSQSTGTLVTLWRSSGPSGALLMFYVRNWGEGGGYTFRLHMHDAHPTRSSLARLHARPALPALTPRPPPPPPGALCAPPPSTHTVTPPRHR